VFRTVKRALYVPESTDYKLWFKLWISRFTPPHNSIGFPRCHSSTSPTYHTGPIASLRDGGGTLSYRWRDRCE
jgi:hypothetical protein